MFTYQAQLRFFKFADKQPDNYPCEAIVSLHLEPKQAFGLMLGGGRTMLAGSAARIYLSLDNGRGHVENPIELGALDVTIDGSRSRLQLRGNVLTYHEIVDSLLDAYQMIETLYFGIPTVLAVHYADPPYVERIEGSIDGKHFTWELKNWQITYQLSTRELQERAFLEAWTDLATIALPQHRRLAGALGYFHTGCRLLREAKTPGEFLAEALLNFCKVLELLFPGDRDSLRVELRKNNIDNEIIERDLVPITLLRNTFDVAHSTLSLLTTDQASTLQRYAERVEVVIHQLLKQLLVSARTGDVTLAAYKDAKLDGASARILEQLKSHLDELEKCTGNPQRSAFRIRR